MGDGRATVGMEGNEQMVGIQTKRDILLTEKKGMKTSYLKDRMVVSVTGGM